MMVRRETLEKAGPMPEVYFLYYEELDWSVRIREQGRRIAYDPRCTVFHKESATTGQQSPLRSYCLTRNRLLFAWRNLRGGARLLSVAYQLCIAAPKNAVSALAHRRGDLAKAVCRGVRDFFTLKTSRHDDSSEHSRLDLHLRTGTSGALSFRLRALLDAQNMDDYPQAKRRRKFVTLIPAYKSDAVIVRTAQAALRQEYPAQLHEVVVIADRLKPETLAELRTLPIRVLEVSFENSSKAKALNFAVEELESEAAEAVTILDADNLAGEDFIARLNDVFDSGVQAVQAHRTAKNRDTDTAVLDAASEEINNAIFRRGHVALGLSSALIGSGMAFEYKWFRDNIARCTTSGEDKELEALLLRQGIYIDYIDGLRVLDEKVQGEGAYYNQRRRWIAAQFYALGSAVRQLPGAIAAGNLDYCDKLLQWCLPPRILLMGLVPLWTAAMTVFDPLGSIKWWIVLLLLLFALALALPDEQTDRQLGRALRRMPVLFLLTAANLFRLRGTKDKFIHTEHTGAGGNAPGANTPTEP